MPSVSFPLSDTSLPLWDLQMFQGLFLPVTVKCLRNLLRPLPRPGRPSGPKAVGRRCWCPDTGFAAEAAICFLHPWKGLCLLQGLKGMRAASRPEGCSPAPPCPTHNSPS